MSCNQAPSESQGTFSSEGRRTTHSQKKQNRNISVTPDGWKGVQSLARKHGCSSVSDLVEKLGREQLTVGSSATIGEVWEPSTAANVNLTAMLLSVLETSAPQALEAFFDKHVPRALYKAISDCGPVAEALLEQQMRTAQLQIGSAAPKLQPQWSVEPWSSQEHY